MSANKRITNADIAREAGVSTAMVTQVLRGGSSTVDETRDRVFEVARRLGYLPRPVTQTLSGTHIAHLGVIVKSYSGEDIFQNNFYAEVIKGIENECGRHQITPVYAVVPVDADSHILEIPRMVIDRQVDGVLAVGLNLDEESTLQIDRYGVPVVLVDAYSETNAYDSAEIANFQGVYEAVSYLISQGHHFIAMAGSSPSAFPGILERRRGYVQALLDNGINDSFFIDSLFDRDEAYHACLAYFKQNTSVTAVIGVNDWITGGVLKALRELEIPVPEAISLVGFDDFIAETFDPPLTAMGVDRIGLGQLAVKLLFNRVQNPFSALIKAALRPKLVVRTSTLRLDLSQENK
jgi:LacI family transcriptional regulator